MNHDSPNAQMDRMSQAKMAALKIEGSKRLIAASANLPTDEILFTLAQAEGINFAAAKAKYAAQIVAAKGKHRG